MKLWLISQERNNGFDTFDSAVVAARNEDEAKRIHPNELPWSEEKQAWTYPDGRVAPNYSWSPPDYINVELIGTAKSGTAVGVIVASFNAG